MLKYGVFAATVQADENTLHVQYASMKFMRNPWNVVMYFIHSVYKNGKKTTIHVQIVELVSNSVLD